MYTFNLHLKFLYHWKLVGGGMIPPPPQILSVGGGGSTPQSPPWKKPWCGFVYMNYDGLNLIKLMAGRAELDNIPSESETTTPK